MSDVIDLAQQVAHLQDEVADKIVSAQNFAYLAILCSVSALIVLIYVIFMIKGFKEEMKLFKEEMKNNGYNS